MNEVLNLTADQQLKPALFETGQTVMTAGLNRWAEQTLPAELLKGDIWAGMLVKAHTRGVGWDNLPGEDGELNRAALRPGREGRIMSVYTLADQTIWVITEWDRSVTTLLFPHEY